MFMPSRSDVYVQGIEKQRKGLPPLQMNFVGPVAQGYDSFADAVQEPIMLLTQGFSGLFQGRMGRKTPTKAGQVAQLSSRLGTTRFGASKLPHPSASRAISMFKPKRPSMAGQNAIQANAAKIGVSYRQLPGFDQRNIVGRQIFKTFKGRSSTGMLQSNLT